MLVLRASKGNFYSVPLEFAHKQVSLEYEIISLFNVFHVRTLYYTKNINHQ
jgi:hypothetical protein